MLRMGQRQPIFATSPSPNEVEAVGGMDEVPDIYSDQQEEHVGSVLTRSAFEWSSIVANSTL